MAQKGIYEQFVRSLAWRSKKRFCEDERIAVALSCGPESSALAALAKQWSGDVGLTKVGCLNFACYVKFGDCSMHGSNTRWYVNDIMSRI